MIRSAATNERKLNQALAELVKETARIAERYELDCFDLVEVLGELMEWAGGGPPYVPTEVPS